MRGVTGVAERERRNGDAFLRAVTADLGLELPAQHNYAVGTAFLPGDDAQVAATVARIEEIAGEEGLSVVGWREVPVDPSILGSAALGVMPQFRQLFVTGATQRVTGMQLERMAFCLRKRAERETDVYFPSLSSRTLVYKGMLTTDQLDRFFPDLVDERIVEQTEAGDHERFAHYVRKEKIVESAVLGAPVVALCGKVWVPGRDPGKFPVCPECREIFEGLPPGGEGSE